jgi:hypothetical protein
MPGIIKEVHYAFLARATLPRWRWLANWKWEIVLFDWIIPAHEGRRDLAEISSGPNDRIFVMFVRYQDVFTKRMHTSRMGMHLPSSESDKPARAGGDCWNDWD